MKPWEFLSKDLKEGNTRMKFADREPYAFWKGNPFVAPHRLDLLKCNVTDKEDWNARLYIQVKHSSVFILSSILHSCSLLP